MKFLINFIIFSVAISYEKCPDKSMSIGLKNHFNAFFQFYNTITSRHFIKKLNEHKVACEHKTITTKMKK